MALFNSCSLISDIIFSDPTVIPVLQRLGIRLGVGDSDVAEACRHQGINTDFFLTIVNTFLNDDYFPESRLRGVDSCNLKNYLRATGQFCRNVQIPNIERHLDYLLRLSGSDNNLAPLKEFFLELKNEVIAVVDKDCVDDLMLGSGAWESIGEKVSDLVSFFVIHLKGNYDSNLCVGVVNAIFMLEKDIRQNNRLRQRILSVVPHPDDKEC